MRYFVILPLAGLAITSCGTTSVQHALERPLEQVIYDDCMPVQIAKFTEDKKGDNPEMVAHFYCKVVSGICRDDPTSEDCKKGIVDYDYDRKGSGVSELYKAAEAGNAFLVAQLLKMGFDPLWR